MFVIEGGEERSPKFGNCLKSYRKVPKTVTKVRKTLKLLQISCYFALGAPKGAQQSTQKRSQGTGYTQHYFH